MQACRGSEGQHWVQSSTEVCLACRCCVALCGICTVPPHCPQCQNCWDGHMQWPWLPEAVCIGVAVLCPSLIALL